MKPGSTLYSLLCVVIPLLWGVLAARVFDWVTTRWPRRSAANPSAETLEESAEMYHI